jgi:hypothetical protein
MRKARSDASPVLEAVGDGLLLHSSVTAQTV